MPTVSFKISDVQLLRIKNMPKAYTYKKVWEIGLDTVENDLLKNSKIQGKKVAISNNEAAKVQ